MLDQVGVVVRVGVDAGVGDLSSGSLYITMAYHFPIGASRSYPTGGVSDQPVVGWPGDTMTVFESALKL